MISCLPPSLLPRFYIGSHYITYIVIVSHYVTYIVSHYIAPHYGDCLLSRFCSSSSLSLSQGQPGRRSYTQAQKDASTSRHAHPTLHLHPTGRTLALCPTELPFDGKHSGRQLCSWGPSRSKRGPWWPSARGSGATRELGTQQTFKKLLPLTAFFFAHFLVT